METSGFDANGAAMAKETYDEVLVFARVRLHNQSKQPLFLHEILTNATLSDGIHSSYAATAGDFDRIFVAYPELAALHGKSLSPETNLDPGQSVEGEIVSSFRLTKQQWDERKLLDFTFAFRYQPNLALAPRTAVIEQ